MRTYQKLTKFKSGRVIRETYVNPFKDCDDLKTFSHILSLINQGKFCPTLDHDLPYGPHLRHSEEHLKQGNAPGWDGFDPGCLPDRVWVTLYQDAIQCYIQLKSGHKLPSLPNDSDDPLRGLKYLEDRCKEPQSNKAISTIKNPGGCIDPKEFRWLAVQKKVIDYWDKLKKEKKPFPSINKIADDLGENWGTVNKAILYSKTLTAAYNKGKPADKKKKYKTPALDQAAYEKWQKKGKKAPMYEQQKEHLLALIKREAKKLKKDIDPTAQVFAEFVLGNMKAVSGLQIDGLSKLYEALKQKKAAIIKDFQDTYSICTSHRRRPTEGGEVYHPHKTR